MGIFGTARGVVDKAEGQIDNMSIQMHNRQFEQYDKKSLTKEEAKELISTVISSNKKATSNAFRVELWVYDNAANNYFGTYQNGNTYIIDSMSYDGSTYDSSDSECIMNFDPVYKNVLIEYNTKGLIKYIEVYN